ncbi:MAG: 50S ribosomal protein L40e [archaeon]
MASTIVKERRLNRKICRKCKSRNPPSADKCRKCGSKQLRMKSKETRGLS